MADRKAGGDIAGIVAAVAGIISAVTPIVNDAMEKRKDKVSGNELVSIPALYDKSFPLKMEQASELLTNYGLKAMPSMLTLREARVKYKDCFDGQVISSKPRSNQKVRPGTTVLIRYITQEVIDESRRLFDEAEKQKVAAKQERAVKRSEQMGRAKDAVVDVAGRAKSGVEKIVCRKNTKSKKIEIGRASCRERV